MKVAHVATVDMSLRYLLLNQLTTLLAAGYEVAAISSPGPNRQVLETVGVRYLPVSMSRDLSPLTDLVSFWRLFRLMRRERFSIVHTHNPKPGLLGQLAARLAGVPIVVNTLHGFYFHDGMRPGWRQFYITLEKVAARCSDAILSQSIEDMQTAIAEGICLPGKIEHLGNGIELSRFDPARLDKGELSRTRDQLGLPAGSPVVGFVGRLVTEKGILELLEAARTVVARMPGVFLLIVGPVDHEKRDAVGPGIAAGYGLSDRCVFTGMRQDMPELYALMDVFVLPSHREGLPRSAMEASAMGVPCVVTDIRGCREAVVHGSNGLLVPLGDVPALADAIVELLNDRDKAARLGQAGRRIARERFDERRVFEMVESTYARLLREKGLPAPTPRLDCA